tara:strand:+ start:245 stop:412 length:168 start_codon:yes stop_codon:yes gene_type:complete
MGSAWGKPALFVTMGKVINNIDPKKDKILLNENTFIKKNINTKAVVNKNIKLRTI